MLKVNQILRLYLMIFVFLIQTGIASAGNSLNAFEVLSIKTGKGPNNIVNQFGGGITDPFNAFAVDSKGNILIGDDGNHRIMRFSKEGKVLDSFTASAESSLIPFGICFDENNNIYVRNERKSEIIVFSPDGKILRSYNPGSIVFQNKYKLVPIISLSCDKKLIRVVFGVDDIKMIRPVYQDEYDQQFNLVNRKVFDDEVAYYKTLGESNRKRGFEKLFEDSLGSNYGHPIVKNWYGKFLPLLKYSPKGNLLYKIDGSWLTEHTKYKVYDYYTMKKLGDWRSAKRSKFMIVNWYVTPDGAIYSLITNKDYVKVLRIEE